MKVPAINAETEVLLVAEDEELIHGNNYEMALMSCYPGTAGICLWNIGFIEGV